MPTSQSQTDTMNAGAAGMNYPTYVLVTPARNEALFIEGTIRSVVGQTLRPARWIIVSDGSTDGTDEIVRRYVATHDWIELVRMPERTERNFAGKVYAFKEGYARVKDLKYDIIGSLDADITFDADYFSFLLNRFVEDTRLGVAGTPFREGSKQYDYRYTSIEHVSGACQLFKRKCFEEIGGYVPMKSGGIDHVAVITARMKGWKTRTFTEKVCRHHRPLGTARYSLLMSRFKVGALDYALGGHLIWELFRTTYQMTKKPYIVGGLMILIGYLGGIVRQSKRPVSPELVKFRRDEQMLRLKKFLTGTRLT